jgi:AcrR family transcriptional regulator
MAKKGDRKAERKALLEAVTRQCIERAVLETVRREGVQELTMEKVAAEAGVAKGTLYLYFKDKSQLLRSVYELSLQPLRDRFKALLSGPFPPLEKLDGLCHTHLAFFDENRSLFRMLIHERNLSLAQWDRYKNSRYQQSVATVARVMAEGIEAGALVPCDPGKAAAVFVEATIAMNQRRLMDESPGPVEEDARFLSDFLLHGLASPGGPEKKKKGKAVDKQKEKRGAGEKFPPAAPRRRREP